jgi:uncharacterized damage-inducible protein DinB
LPCGEEAIEIEMSEADSLAAEVRRAVAGDPWFGPATHALLADVDAATAQVRLPGANHDIWEIVRHLTVWARYVAYRLDGGVPRDPEEGDWPAVTRTDDAAWAEALDELCGAHDEVVHALGHVSEEALDAVTDLTPRDDAGEPVTLRRVVAGVAQHAAYHTGQIAVLKRLAAARSDPV